MNFGAVVFDLDGTLLDTLEDLADSMNAALAAEGYPMHPIEAYRYFVGNGIEALVCRTLPAEARDADTLARTKAALEAEYGRRWNAKTRPYAGVPELLDELSRRQVPMAILSNKPESFTLLTVGELLARWSFAQVRGARPDIARKPDPAGALAIAVELGLDPAACL
jgi:phosphoglycolate phosphatase